jgi:murein DD-endopeptidase MepM/ murein hydrolase activator NlpD
VAKSGQVEPARTAWTARKVVADGKPVAGGREHVVKQGETGIAIAQAYGVPWREVVTANRLVPPYLLRVGDRLLIPMQQNVAARPPSLEERARSFRLDIDDIVTGGEPAEAAGTPRTAPDLAANAPAFRWPVEGRIISGFGPKPAGRFNDGVNIRVPAGTPVKASADGTVAYAGDAIPGFGNLLLIRHAGGWVTAYGHNEALLVERGKAVKAGEVVARSGATGQVSEPQLHFEIRRGRTAIDPQTLAR